MTQQSIPSLLNDFDLGGTFCTEMLFTAPQQWMAVPVAIYLVLD